MGIGCTKRIEIMWSLRLQNVCHCRFCTKSIFLAWHVQSGNAEVICCHAIGPQNWLSNKVSNPLSGTAWEMSSPKCTKNLQNVCQPLLCNNNIFAGVTRTIRQHCDYLVTLATYRIGHIIYSMKYNKSELYYLQFSYWGNWKTPSTRHISLQRTGAMAPSVRMGWAVDAPNAQKSHAGFVRWIVYQYDGIGTTTSLGLT